MNRNMIGSVHHWSPGTSIVVYDLGIHGGLSEIGSYCNVTVIPFPFDKVC